eukprot:3595391-Pleurochrysis_carterae.AAC.1
MGSAVIPDLRTAGNAASNPAARWPRVLLSFCLSLSPSVPLSLPRIAFSRWRGRPEMMQSCSLLVGPRPAVMVPLFGTLLHGEVQGMMEKFRRFRNRARHEFPTRNDPSSTPYPCAFYGGSRQPSIRRLSYPLALRDATK